jgi:hypothetical protein
MHGCSKGNVVPNASDVAAARPDAAAAISPWCQSRWAKFGRSDHELHRKRSGETSTLCVLLTPTIADAIKMLEEQNSVLSHIMDNILQDRYQVLPQTSLTDGLSQALFTSVVEQARLCNLLADHMKKSPLNTSNSLLPPSKLLMDLTKEEGKSRNRK